MGRKNSENDKLSETVSLAISYIRNVQDLKELEKQLGQDLTPELLKEIGKKLISMKKGSINTRREYIKSGNRQALLEQELQLSDLRYIDKKFRIMRQNGTDSEEYLDRSSTKKMDYHDKLMLDMEMLNYWIEEAENVYRKFQSATTLEDKTRLLKQLENLYEKK